MSEPAILRETHLEGLSLLSRGKVRDIYEVDGRLLIVSTDRISAFDYVLPGGIPDKGKVLNQLSLFWFDRTRDIVPNHVAAGRVSQFPESLQKFQESLSGRAILAKKARMFQAEARAP